VAAANASDTPRIGARLAVIFVLPFRQRGAVGPRLLLPFLPHPTDARKRPG